MKILKLLNCLLLQNHKWGGYKNNFCQSCGKKAIGIPKYNAPAPPSKIKP